MKTTIFTLLLFSIQILFGQEITGLWKGELEIQDTKLPLLIHIKKEGEKLNATMDSPKQGATNIPVTTTNFTNNQLDFDVANIGVSYTGKLYNSIIEGVFKQGNMSLPLVFSKIDESEISQVLKRPQTPKAPFSYKTEDVSFVNSVDKNTLAGTISEPKNFDKKAPILVMITGSGSQNRDEELFGHKPFAVIADDFAKKGIATLRIDDRGVGGSSKGKKDDTTYNFASDIDAAVHFLQTKGYQNIGLIGHSEGGMIAPMVATMNKNVTFLVLMAGPGTPIDELLAKQNYLMSKLAGTSEDELQKDLETNHKIYDYVKNYSGQKYEEDLRTFLKNIDPKTSEDAINQLKNAWFVYFMKFNPDDFLTKVRIPVLAINGSLDFQVPAKDNLEAIKNSLTKAKNKNFETYEFEGLNHLFQECKTGEFQEYGEIEQTISPKVLDKMSVWVLKRK